MSVNAPILCNTNQDVKPLRFGNKKGFPGPHNGIIFSENSVKISSH